MLSDLGGYAGIITIIFATISSTWNYNAYDNFMVSRLFKIKKPKDEFNEDDPVIE